MYLFAVYVLFTFYNLIFVYGDFYYLLWHKSHLRNILAIYIYETSGLPVFATYEIAFIPKYRNYS